jgi:ABC-type Na+ transport system ATPase subunit NatA
VDGLDLEVAAGACFGLLGPNGAGKTTTIRVICAASPRDAGEVDVLGLDPARSPRELKGLIGVVPQIDNLDPDFTVLKNLVVYGRYFGIPADRARARAKELLGFVRLSDREGAGVEELSGGLKRRLVIARALLHEPRLLVLDEPTTGLDPQSRHELWERVRDLRRRGVTVLLTTTTWRRRRPSATGWPSWTTGRCWSRVSPPSSCAATRGARSSRPTASTSGTRPPTRAPAATPRSTTGACPSTPTTGRRCITRWYRPTRART